MMRLYIVVVTCRSQFKTLSSNYYNRKWGEKVVILMCIC